MRKSLQSVILVLVLFSISSCEKEEVEYASSANIYVINSAVDAGSVKVNAGASSEFSYSKATDLAFGSSAVYGSFKGTKTITAVSSVDTTKSFFLRTINLESVSTLYIAGMAPNVDTLFRTETNLPYISNSGSLTQDNSIYIRFVNLSPNSTPLNINIRLATENEVTALPYKGISLFKKYVALTTTPNYVFEVRDAATNTIQTTFTLPNSTYRFKTISLVVKGLLGTTTGVNAFGVFVVSYT